MVASLFLGYQVKSLQIGIIETSDITLVSARQAANRRAGSPVPWMAYLGRRLSNKVALCQRFL